IHNWNELSGANGKSGTIVPRARIPQSGTRDDMNRLFAMERGNLGSSSPYTAQNCNRDGKAPANSQLCEPFVIDASGAVRFTSSQEEGDSICASADSIAYTSLANLALYGPNTTKCNDVSGGSGHTIKALALQSCSYANYFAGGTP